MANATKNGFMRYFALLFVGIFTLGAVHALLQTGLASENTPALSAPRVSEDCLGCHEGQDVSLALTPHRLNANPDDPDAWIACSDCHPGDPRHYEDDPEEFLRTNPAMLSPGVAAELCSSCHMNAHQQNMLEQNVHAENDVSCTDCHKLHGTSAPGLLQSDQSTLCMGCHSQVEGEFSLPFRHPVNDEIVNCMDCHLTLDTTARGLSLNGTNVCLDCHMEFQGPFPYEHQATVDYSTEEGGCLTCHEAHGSLLPRMLKQPYGAGNSQLCAQCHSVPLHESNAQHGTTWAGLDCNTCHTDIHGSYTSRNFLSETLEGQGCFNVGCHGF